MSRRKDWSRKKRISLVVLAVIAIATSAWAAISQSRASSLSHKAVDLAAPIPAEPREVFIQKRDNIDGLGNAFVLVQLTEAQIKAKQEDGTIDFLTIGDEEIKVILRDDGAGGDTKARDGLYTGFTEINEEELEARARLDERMLKKNPDGLVPVFSGRAAIGVTRPRAFEFGGFANGDMVALGPMVSFLQPEGVKPPPITFELPITPGVNPFQEQVLMITNTDVVTDPDRIWDPCNETGNPDGVWTFKHLMTGIAGAHPSNPAAPLVKDWLEHWNTTYSLHNDPVPARTRIQHILDQWPKLNGDLDLGRAPLRLLAIVPRVDLRGGGGGYGGGNFNDAGELRFIFGFVAKSVTTPPFDPGQAFTGEVVIDPGNPTCFALPFTIIFEYRAPDAGCEAVKSWAQQWVDLETLSGDSYRDALEALTERVVKVDAIPTAPNGSALKQLRTNEVALADVANGDPWELRQFQLGLGSPFALLTPGAVEDTIQDDPTSNKEYNQDVNGSGLLTSWIRNEMMPVISGNNEAVRVPPLLVTPKYRLHSSTIPNPNPLEDFLAADARIEEPDPTYIKFYWGVKQGPNALNVNPTTHIKENWARHRVSRASCSGCHRRETFTHFTHVNPADTIILSTWDSTYEWTFPPGVPNVKRADPKLPAELSLFLTGINQLGDPGNGDIVGDVRNPNVGNPKRNFDDLARREKDINAVATMSCSGMLHANLDAVQRHMEMTGKLPEFLFEGVSLKERLSVSIDDLKRNAITEVH